MQVRADLWDGIPNKTNIIEYNLDGRVQNSTAEKPAGKKKKLRQKKSSDSEDFFFDFIADTGDGWNSTYSIAHLLSRDKLNIQTTRNSTEKISLPRGKFLIIGGDAVYPGASDEEYRNRLVRPFSYAWDWCWSKHSNVGNESDSRERGCFVAPKERPGIFAIPGNHDWYDCLSSFRRRFCNQKYPRSFGQWITGQSRSYFAIKLPWNWYILALDIGLAQNLDNAQFNYFMNVVRTMKSADKIILICAEPLWVFGGIQNNKLYRLLESLEDEIESIFELKNQKPPKIWLNLAGDIHNYQRYERSSLESIEEQIQNMAGMNPEIAGNSDKLNIEIKSRYHQRQSIVCGGGGAFLHPTHGEARHHMSIIPKREFRMGREQDDNRIELPVEDQQEYKCSWPDKKLSQKLGWRLAWKFLLKRENWWVAFFIGVGHTLMTFPIITLLKQYSALGIMDSLQNPMMVLVLSNPVLTICSIAGCLLMIWIYARLPSIATPGYPHKTHYAGWIVGIVQVSVAIFSYMIVNNQILPLNDWLLDWPEGLAITGILLTVFLNVILGSMVYSTSMAAFTGFFGMMHNDAFAHGGVDGYKSLLRIRLSSDGNLTVYPIGLVDPVRYSVPDITELDPANWDESCLGKSGQKTKDATSHNNPGQISAINKLDVFRDHSYITQMQKPVQKKSLKSFLIEKPVKIKVSM